MVDATNAFYCLNRRVALLNISVLCPSLARFFVNIYRNDGALFVGGEVIYSAEGTTQGDPMAIYDDVCKSSETSRELAHNKSVPLGLVFT